MSSFSDASWTGMHRRDACATAETMIKATLSNWTISKPADVSNWLQQIRNQIASKTLRTASEVLQDYGLKTNEQLTLMLMSAKERVECLLSPQSIGERGAIVGSVS